MRLCVLLVIFTPVLSYPSSEHVNRFEMPEEPTSLPPDIDHETRLSATETIVYRGFQAEEHKVTTTDGYILTLQRIVPKTSDAKVVILWHGLLDSGFTWVTNLRYQSLAFILADNGFDVWLGNSRGSKYSREHVKYNPDKDRKYWDFSFDEMAKYDVPAAVNYLRNVTKKDKISWVGHSQGCLIAIAGFIDPQVASAIDVFVALAPAARVDHATAGLRYIAPFATTIEAAMVLFGSTGEFLPNDKFMQFLGRFLCGKQPILCQDVIFLVAGYNATNMNLTRMPVYVAHTPAGTSTQNLVHFAQLIMDKKFQYFDYGRKKNEQIYHQPTPPLYDVTKMLVTTAVFWSPDDELADEIDVRWLLTQLPHVLFNKSIDGYSHLDFTWAENAYQRVYADVLSVLRQQTHTVHHLPTD